MIDLFKALFEEYLVEEEQDYIYLGTKDGHKIYKILNANGCIKFGENSGWALAGKYGKLGHTGAKPDLASAEKYFNNYVDNYNAKIYMLVNTKTDETKYVAIYFPDGDTFDIFDIRNNKITGDVEKSLVNTIKTIVNKTKNND